MNNHPLPDYLVDYADDPSSISVPGHPAPTLLSPMLASLDLNDPDFGIRLDGDAMAAAAERVWLRLGAAEEFDEHGPPDPDGILEPGIDWWMPCDDDHLDAEAWTQMPVIWAARDAMSNTRG